MASHGFTWLHIGLLSHKESGVQAKSSSTAFLKFVRLSCTWTFLKGILHPRKTNMTMENIHPRVKMYLLLRKHGNFPAIAMLVLFRVFSPSTCLRQLAYGTSSPGSTSSESVHQNTSPGGERHFFRVSLFNNKNMKNKKTSCFTSPGKLPENAMNLAVFVTP